MNVHNMLSHGDTPLCQIWYAYVQEQDNLRHNKIHGVNIILILRPKIKVIQRSQMYVTHHPMVKHSCARYGMTVTCQ